MKVKKLKEPKEDAPEKWGIPTRTWLGAAVSIGYVGLLISLIIWRWCDLQKLDLNALGDFVAGAVGPMAFLWLVLGYLQQGDELKQNTAALEMQARELASTVEQQKELVTLGNLQLKEERLRSRREELTREAAVRPRFEFNLREEAREVSEFRRFSLWVSNRGTPCSHLRVTASGIGVAERQDLRDNNSQTWGYTINYPSDKPLADFDMYIGYVDSSGKPGNQDVIVTAYHDEDTDELIIGGEDDVRVWNETLNHLARRKREMDE